MTNERIQTFAASHRIEWHFIVERAVWWGGFWERMVRTVKDALKLSIGRRSLKYDELQTVLTEVEATVNSRPLTYVGNDADNIVILTPSHFLIGTNECGFFMDFTDPEIKRQSNTRYLEKTKRCVKILLEEVVYRLFATTEVVP
nr:unnamed protein product [Callosobruchus analis]